MFSKYQKYSKEKIVTVFVLVAWFLVLLIPSIIHVKVKNQEQNAILNEEAIFLNDKHRLEETIILAYKAVQGGSVEDFEKVVDVDSVLIALTKDLPELTKAEFLQAIKDKRFVDSTTPYGVKIQKWKLVNAQNENVFYKFIKGGDGKYLNVGGHPGYAVDLQYQAYDYMRNSLNIRLVERDGRFYISSANCWSMLNYQRKMDSINRPEIWDEAEKQALETIKWKFGEISWGASKGPSRGMLLPIEIEANNRNIKLVSFKAQIIEPDTNAVVDTFFIYASDKKGENFLVGKSATVMGTDSYLDANAVPLLRDGRLVLGRIVPVDAVYEGNSWETIAFSKALGGI